MASIKKRGPRNAPRYYVNYTIGRNAGGKRVQTDRLLKGIQTREQAIQELARVERELAAGKNPFAVGRLPEVVGPLLKRWRDGLTNRNADDDRSRIDRRLVPKFGSMTIDAVTLPVVMDWIDELATTALSPSHHREAFPTLRGSARSPPDRHRFPRLPSGTPQTGSTCRLAAPGVLRPRDDAAAPSLRSP
jgi:hypothetical protein